MNHEQEAWTRIYDEIMHPLRHVVCPSCNVRFGIDKDEFRFMEQTEVTFWCPRGHQLKIKATR